jgi:hypothetical protein
MKQPVKWYFVFRRFFLPLHEGGAIQEGAGCESSRRATAESRRSVFGTGQLRHAREELTAAGRCGARGRLEPRIPRETARLTLSVWAKPHVKSQTSLVRKTYCSLQPSPQSISLLGEHRSSPRQMVTSPTYVSLAPITGGFLCSLSEGGLAMDLFGGILCDQVVQVCF